MTKLMKYLHRELRVSDEHAFIPNKLLQFASRQIEEKRGVHMFMFQKLRVSDEHRHEVKRVLMFIILLLIRLYQQTFSPNHGLIRRPYRGCRFYPSCSEYIYQAIEKHGVLKGIFAGAKRIVRCHPWNKGGYDPVGSHNT